MISTQIPLYTACSPPSLTLHVYIDTPQTVGIQGLPIDAEPRKTNLHLILSGQADLHIWEHQIAKLVWRRIIYISCNYIQTCVLQHAYETQLTSSQNKTAEPLYTGHSELRHLSNEDSVCCSNHIELCTNLPLN